MTNEDDRNTDWRRRALDLQTSLEALPDLYFRLDSTGLILDCREGRVANLYRPRDYFLGRRVSEVMPPPVGLLLLHALQKAHQTGAVVTVEYSLPVRGVEEFFEARFIPFDQNQIVAIARNITARKQMEVELAAARRHLAAGRWREQLRMAHRLHDGPVQSLFGISLLVYELVQGTSDEAWTAEQRLEEVAVGLTRARREILTVISDLREQLVEMHEMGLTLLDLASALRGWVAELEARPQTGGLALELDVPQSGPPLPEPLRVCLFRIAQEAVRNAIRHAQARRLTLTLAEQEGEVMLRVADDGCGFVVPSDPRSFIADRHFGLVGMYEQVNEVGGRLTLRSQPGQGTEVIVQIPLSQEETGE